jgi:hypothetical protein
MPIKPEKQGDFETIFVFCEKSMPLVFRIEALSSMFSSVVNE